MEKRNVYAFDFDGTLTKGDTLPLFLFFAVKRYKLFVGMLLFFPLLLMMKIRLLPNWKVKQWLFSFCFAGMEEDRFNVLCKDFAKRKQKILRREGIDKVTTALSSGAEVLVVSASIDNWVAPFFAGMPVKVIGTQIEVCDGLVTGRFKTRNCYGAEKVKRILAELPDRDDYTLIAYGDSRGDKDMLGFADKAYYKPFTK